MLNITILTGEEMAEMQELVDAIMYSVRGLWISSEYYEEEGESIDIDTIKRIAEILGLEINPD